MNNIKIKLTGLTCAACEKLSAKRLSAIAGVVAVSVDKNTGLAVIKATRNINLSEINEAFQGTEYRAELFNN